jgi:hypothetical protein
LPDRFLPLPFAIKVFVTSEPLFSEPQSCIDAGCDALGLLLCDRYEWRGPVIVRDNPFRFLSEFLRCCRSHAFLALSEFLQCCAVRERKGARTNTF